MNKGKFITFEGGEGSGKSTQLQYLYDKLKELNIKVKKTREPGGTDIGEKIRELLVSGKVDTLSPLTELLLNSASRKEHIEKVIKPTLENGEWILCDRYIDSTLVYQGYSHGLDIKMVNYINDITTSLFKPDLVFIFDISPEEGLKRALKRKNNEDRYEKMDMSFHNKIRHAYLDISKTDIQKYKVIDSTLDKIEISKIIETIITKLYIPY